MSAIVRKMPIEEWQRAKGQLLAIKHRTKIPGLSTLLPMMGDTLATLETDRLPAVAGMQLAYIGDRIRVHSELRKSIVSLSLWLIDYTGVEPNIPILAAIWTGWIAFEGLPALTLEQEHVDGTLLSKR